MGAVRRVIAGALVALAMMCATASAQVTVVSSSRVYSGLFAVQNSIGTTSTDGGAITNDTPATAGVPQQQSPRFRFCGAGYNSVSTLSERACFAIEEQPSTAAGATLSYLYFKGSVNGGAYSTDGAQAAGFQLGSSGNVNFFTGAGGLMFFSGRSTMSSPADGNLLFQANAGGTFSLLQLGCTTSACPAVKRSSASVVFRLADDSADAAVQASVVTASQRVITQGAGTGITVNDQGELATQVYKVTIDKSAFVCAAVTCDVTIATLPAKTFVQHALADLTVAFTCSATCTTSTLSFTLGKTAGGNQYLLTVDADAATGQFGTTAAQLGASLAPATTPTEVGDLASWTTTTAIVVRLTSGTGNIGTGAATNLGAGSVTFYLTTTRMP